jgi:hypothetical protein
MSDIIQRDQVFTGRKLASLPKTQFSGLDFDNIIADVTELITENPEYNKNWDDFLSSNAGRLMIEFFAYITDQLATRIDWVVNESFIGTATQKKSIIRLLKLIGYNFGLPKAARVVVDVSFDRPVGEVRFSGFEVSGQLDFFSLNATGLDGTERKNFEAILFNENNQKYEYRNSPINIQTGSLLSPELDHKIVFHEGRTIVFTVTVNTNNNFIFQLDQFPVIEGSVRVYMVKSNGEEVELERVLSFLDPKAQREEDTFGNKNEIPYIINVLDQNIVEIEFGPTSILTNSSRRPEVGNNIKVYYRVGGGENGNITKRSINTNRRINLLTTSNQIETVNVGFVNNSQGFLGEESEDVSFASVFAPLQIKTVNKAVTEEDYDILLLSKENIIKSKSYGNNNLPLGFFQKYNVFIKPLEVWNYSILKKPNWTEIPPSRYNDFEWIQLRLENRFNQKVSFTKGSFNNLYTIFTNEIEKEDLLEIEENTFYKANNFIKINTDNFFKNAINEKIKIKITSKNLKENYYFLAKENNIFNEQVELLNKGEIDFSKNILSIKQEENAYYVSSVNLENKFTAKTNSNKLRISLDNREEIEVDLSSINNGMEITAEQIRDEINSLFRTSSFYNNETTENEEILENGSQALGLNFESMEDLDRDTELLRNKNYYFKVNGIEFFINTGEERLTFQDLRKKIDESFGVVFRGDISSRSNIIKVTDGTFKKNFINKGSLVLSEGSVKYLNDFPVKEYNWITDEITLDGNETPSVTRTNHPFRVRTFCTECIQQNSEGKYDIAIKNLSVNPYGVVLLQKTDRDESEDLFTALGLDLQNEPEDSRGVPGYHDLGINGAINPTRGFQAFNASKNKSNINNGERNFILEIDGGEDDFGITEEISIILGSQETLYTIREKLISEMEEIYVYDLDLDLIDLVEIPEIDTYDDLRIFSKTTGSKSKILITRKNDNQSIPSLIDELEGVDEPVDGIDSPPLGLEPGEYSFKINNHTYKVQIHEEDTFEDLINALNGNEYEEGVLDYFTASIVFEEDDDKEWERDIRITSDFSNRVYVEDIDLFKNLKIKKIDVYEIFEENWENFGNIIGGGDYSEICKVFDAVENNEILKILKLRSPSIGRYNSVVKFHYFESGNANREVFGIQSNNDEENYGYKKITIMQKEPDFGNIIYENGSLNFFGRETKDFYLNYLNDFVNEIPLGTFNTSLENFDEEDPSFREPAYRLYNTIYDRTTQEIDYFKSNFQLKYTKEKTDEVSIFSIENDFPEISKISDVKLFSIENPNEFIKQQKNGVEKKYYLLKINVDGISDVEVDISGNLGQGPDSENPYTLQEIAKNINQAFDLNDNYNFGVYKNFNFAVVEDNRIVIQSPTESIESKITFKIPSDSEVDASNELFLIDFINGEKEIISTGDYYISENKQIAVGRIEFGNNIIENIPDEIFSIIQIGDKIYQKENVLLKSIVLSKEENSSIRISNAALSTRNEEEFFFSNNLMMLKKIEKEESNIPDLDFFVHFVNDKRYVEGIFDGRTVTDLESGRVIKTLGYPLGSLDEDILIDFMNDKKILSVENVFKQTKFRTFDIKADVYYNRTFSREDIRQRVERSLRNFYNIRNRNYGQSVTRSKIMSIIHENVGVEFIELQYLGLDATNPETSVENTINADFDEIIVLSENQSRLGQITRGLIFNYLVDGSI